MDEVPPLVARLEAASRRAETPCGRGGMVWHLWGEGPPLVLLHGGAGSWRHWARNIEALSRNRLVLAADLPGLGESDLPPLPPTPQGVTAVLSAGLDALLGPGTRFDLMGFSFGAVLSGGLAALRDRDLRSLTLVGAGGLGLPRPPVVLEKIRDKRGEERAAAHRTNLARLMLADPARIDATALAIQSWNSDHTRINSRSFMSPTWLRDALPGVTAPLNVIFGERDAIAWPQLEARFDLIRGIRPDARCRAIPGAGHWVAYEAAEAFNQAVEGMLPPAA
ncbi:alpha/beta fold hydrolase [Roseomonas sp. E05]|uniref:alpha/beta fold hydrolase n=1 Tax=Roseomonas sp. E05 TaxID=3046310 RepID=UPI0024B9C0C0|nr:alpha/beta fold hydrolase [Roseomonas sp. E05]MDJ0386993.1 alpha/beta fold hydrolase [Roseomonas sp. E05]